MNSTGTESSSESMSGIPDAVLAVVTQFILGIALATTAVPPTVLSVQDRAAETMGVFVVLLVTSVIAFPLRATFGMGDISSTEYILAVLAPIVTRLDLGLLIWVNVNKSLLWVDQMLYASHEELECVSLIVLASSAWHNGVNRINDPEFGLYGGEAGMQMHNLQRDYNPRNAAGNGVAWLSHLTLWPFATFFHALLQAVSVLGFAVFWVLQHAAAVLSRKSLVQQNFVRRANYFDFAFRRRQTQQRKLFMRHALARVFDANQALFGKNRAKARHRWAMLASVDAVLSHPHFSRVFSISYPMRVAPILQRTLQTEINRKLKDVLTKDEVLFSNSPDEPIPTMGAEASRQVLLYRILSWPDHTPYSADVVERLTKFEAQNRMAWNDTFTRLCDDSVAKSEFEVVRDVLRRAMVQLVVLAWFDGLGECRNDVLRTSRNISISDDLTDNFLQVALASTEMCVRLCNLDAAWNDHRQTSAMILSLRGKMEKCTCEVCTVMERKRQLVDHRYMLRPTMDEMEKGLSDEGCRNASNVCAAWRVGVKSWISEIFEP